MKQYILYTLIIASIFSCKKDEFVHPDYLIFGAIQGDCTGGCRFVYYLDDSKLTEDPNVKYFANRDLADFTQELSADKFEAAKNLLNAIPATLTKTTKTTFIDLNASSPDLWYAEIRLDGHIHTWTFDNTPSGTPSYLKSFADEMIRTIGAIR